MPNVNPVTLLRLIQSAKESGKGKQLERVESRAIANIDYDPESSDLTVEFQKRGTYKYSGVDLDTFVEFSQATSWGTYFNLYIRDHGYSYERIG